MVVTSYKIVQSLISLCSAACIKHPYKTTKERSRNSGPKLLLHIIAFFPGGGYSWEFLMGVCRPVLQILKLFQTKKCHFPHPFSELKKVLYKERLRTKVQPLTLHIPFFERKGTPFAYLPLKNDTSFTYLCKNVRCIPFSKPWE